MALDQRQLALKYSNNSLYGASGALVGCMPHDQRVAKAVTAEGRQSIETVRDACTTLFWSNGRVIKHNDEMEGASRDGWFRLRVLYGDTGAPARLLPHARTRPHARLRPHARQTPSSSTSTG